MAPGPVPGQRTKIPRAECTAKKLFLGVALENGRDAQNSFISDFLKNGQKKIKSPLDAFLYNE